MVWVAFNGLQLGGRAQVDDAIKTPMAFGDPQAHVGAARHQLCFGVLGSGLQQRTQAARAQISRIVGC